jgi:transcription elongation factor Elf1
MSYIDTKYLNIISPYLQQFKKKGDNLWNFRCPYCGDSQKSRTKARGFVFRKKNDLFFKCHNCGVGASLGNLIKTIDSKTYKDYIMERYKGGVETHSSPQPEFKFNAPVFRKKGILEGLQSIKSLPDDHPARQIVERRKLPLESLSDLYLCESFYKFTNSIIKGKFPSLGGDHPRLIIPFRGEDGEVFAYQGRAFGNEQPKYITIKIDEEREKIFGLDKVDKSKPILVVEGPLDSLFLDNCIAVAGADFSNMKGDLIIIYDNEPRNKEINKQIEKTIDQGKSVCLWPDNMKWKDINDMIIAGYSKEQIQDIITNNTFSGASARLRFAEWRKINA